VIVNDTLADATSAAAATLARCLLIGIGSKGAGETLTITWTHDVMGG
jgi:phosphoglycolate phosphatase-like HAD superfamily hydrolase